MPRPRRHPPATPPTPSPPPSPPLPPTRHRPASWKMTERPRRHGALGAACRYLPGGARSGRAQALLGEGLVVGPGHCSQ